MKSISEGLENDMEKKTLGIIGGVGPLATMFIGEMIVRLPTQKKIKIMSIWLLQTIRIFQIERLLF